MNGERLAHLATATSFAKSRMRIIVERRSVARAVEVAEGLADRRENVANPDGILRKQNRDEHLVGDVGELEGQGRGSGAGAAGAGLLLAPPGACRG